MKGKPHLSLKIKYDLNHLLLAATNVDGVARFTFIRAS